MTTNAPTFEEADFRKSSRSLPDQDCVHVARRDGWVAVRDTKKVFGAPDDHRLLFTADQFDGFLEGLGCGELSGQCIEVAVRQDGGRTFRSTVPQPNGSFELEFTLGEFRAFCAAVSEGEFNEHAFSSAA